MQMTPFFLRLKVEGIGRSVNQTQNLTIKEIPFNLDLEMYILFRFRETKTFPLGES
jgi:hypothetical protein